MASVNQQQELQKGLFLEVSSNENNPKWQSCINRLDALNPKHECMVELEYEYKKSKALYYNTQPEFNEMILKIADFLNSFK